MAEKRKGLSEDSPIEGSVASRYWQAREVALERNAMLRFRIARQEKPISENDEMISQHPFCRVSLAAVRTRKALRQTALADGEGFQAAAADWAGTLFQQFSRLIFRFSAPLTSFFLFPHKNKPPLLNGKNRPRIIIRQKKQKIKKSAPLETRGRTKEQNHHYPPVR
jgi:hypothetical protein